MEVCVMDEELYDNIINLLHYSDIRLRTTEIRPVVSEGKTFIHTIIIAESIQDTIIPLKKTPAIVCLLVFSLFDAYIENKYQLETGLSFKKKYNTLTSDSYQKIIEKECYRLMKTLRNCFVHNHDKIETENNVLKFHYINKNTQFNLNISTATLELLYTIVSMLVTGEHEIKTNGHYKHILCTYYKELWDHICKHGDFTDDIGGTIAQVATFVELNTRVRYNFKNPQYHIVKDNKIIVSPINLAEAVDYNIQYKGKTYLIPHEILDAQHSISTNDLEIWEFISG